MLTPRFTGAIATGGAAASGLENVLEQIQRGTLDGLSLTIQSKWFSLGVLLSAC